MIKKKSWKQFQRVSELDNENRSKLVPPRCQGAAVIFVPPSRGALISRPRAVLSSPIEFFVMSIDPKFLSNFLGTLKSYEVT